MYAACSCADINGILCPLGVADINGVLFPRGAVRAERVAQCGKRGVRRNSYLHHGQIMVGVVTPHATQPCGNVLGLPNYTGQGLLG